MFCFIYTNEIQGTGMLQILFFISLERSQGGRMHPLGFMVFGLAMKKS